MTNFTAEQARNIVAASVAKIKSESAESWLSCAFEMIEAAAQQAREEITLTSYFWVHSSPERTKVFQTLKKNGFNIYQNSGRIFDLGEPKIVISWKSFS